MLGVKNRARNAAISSFERYHCSCWVTDRCPSVAGVCPSSMNAMKPSRPRSPIVLPNAAAGNRFLLRSSMACCSKTSSNSGPKSTKPWYPWTSSLRPRANFPISIASKMRGTRPFRINLYQFWIVGDDHDAEADEHVEERARCTSYWSVQDLVAHCDLPSNRAFPAIQRLIARRVLGADWYSVISLQSRVWMI